MQSPSKSLPRTDCTSHMDHQDTQLVKLCIPLRLLVMILIAAATLCRQQQVREPVAQTCCMIYPCTVIWDDRQYRGSHNPLPSVLLAWADIANSQQQEGNKNSSTAGSSKERRHFDNPQLDPQLQAARQRAQELLQQQGKCTSKRTMSAVDGEHVHRHQCDL